MNCVNCKNPLVALDAGGLEIDYCLECSGIWLDAAELEMLCGSKLPADRKLIDTSTEKRADRKCPICGKRMCAACVGEDNEVELDSCENGHGLWFDRGELMSVIDALDESIKKPVAAELRAIFSGTKS